MREVDDVGRPLPDQQSVLDRPGCPSQNSDRQVAAPTLADTRDLGQLVAQPGGDEHPTSDQLLTVGQQNPETSARAAR
jgi:hypothetical protein